VLRKGLFCPRKQTVVVLLHYFDVIVDALLSLIDVVTCFELTVHVSEFRAGSDFINLSVEFSHVLLKLFSLANFDLFVVCE